MEISDVRIKLVSGSNDRLKAFGSVTFDGDFVVRDIKIVEGEEGFFVAMPSRKLSVRCPECRHKNQMRARFCEECGTQLPAQRTPSDVAGRARLHRDVAHPITPAFRERLQARIIEAYHAACDEAIQQAEPSDVDVEAHLTDADADAEALTGVDEDPPRDESEAGDYDSLIADLQGGGGTQDRDRGGQSASRSDSSREADASPRRRRPRRRRDPATPSTDESERVDVARVPTGPTAEPTNANGGQPTPQSAKREEGECSAPVSLPAESVVPTTSASEPEIKDPAPFGGNLAEPSPAADPAEDSTPFGMGIL